MRNKFLTLYLLLLLTIPVRADIITGLVDHWTLDEGAGVSAADTGTNNNVGTLNGGGPVWVAGQVGSNALSFDSSSGKNVSSASTGVPLGASVRTVSLWIYLNSFTSIADATYQAAFSYGVTSATNLFELLVDNTTQTVNYHVFGFFPPIGGIDPGNWYHIVMVYDGTNMIGYFNGATTLNTAVAINTLASSVYIGESAIGGRNFNGRVDDVRIYDRVLSSLDVAELFALGPAPVASASETLAYWKFDEGAGTTAVDSSGHGHVATFFGTPLWATGKRGMALSFDSVGANFVRSGVLAPSGASPRTISAWIYLNSFASIADGSYQVPLSYGSNVAGSLFEILIDNAAQTVNYHTLGLFPSMGLITTGAWHHVVMVYDGTNRIGYLDNVQTLNSAFAINTTASNIYIGSTINGNSRNFNGKIDDVRIYDHALSQREVNSVYMAGRPGIVSRGRSHLGSVTIK